VLANRRAGLAGLVQNITAYDDPTILVLDRNLQGISILVCQPNLVIGLTNLRRYCQNTPVRGDEPFSLLAHLIIFSITHYFGKVNYQPRKTLDNLAALHRFKKLLSRNFVKTLRFKAQEARNKM